MPHCPTCGRPFEAAAQFCPNDGSRLTDDIPAAPVASAPVAAAPGPASQTLPAIVGVLVVAVAGLVGALLWQQQRAAEGTTRAEQAEHDAAKTALPVAAGPPASPPRVIPAVVRPGQSPQTVYAESPRDGYLVLRQGPRVARGTEVLRIPHGSAIELGECRPSETSPGGRWGSWCRARYGAAEGWIFDAFISR